MFEYIEDAKLEFSSAPKKRKKTDLILVHHVEGDMTAPAINEMHKKRGHRGIDYNIYIDRDGGAVWGRGLDAVGGSVNNARPETRGMNACAVAVVCNGNFNKEQMGEKQKHTLRRVLRDLVQYYGIKRILSHKEAAAPGYTDCPGTYFPMDEVRSYALSGAESAIPEAGAFSVTRLLKLKSPMMRGGDVEAVQHALIGRSFSVGRTGADGVYGGNTRAAVVLFQRLRGLRADGIVGRDTTAALGGVWGG